MQLCNFRPSPGEDMRGGIVFEGRVHDLEQLVGGWPAEAPGGRLRVGPSTLHSLVDLVGALDRDALEADAGLPEREVVFGPPVDPVRSFRDFYGFEAHARAVRQRRGLPWAEEWSQFPAFYYSNPSNLVPHGAPLPAPTHGEWLDFELEVGCVLQRGCRDATPDEAEACIAGFAIINDWSLRDVQQAEMAIGLGPAKGKDFATGLGPLLVSPGELEDRRRSNGYDLHMVARVNGAEISRGNWADVHFSFGEMIARASTGVQLRPGDLFGSGTVGTGCLLEVGLDRTGGWLGPGDVVELEIERLGTLRNTIAPPS